MPRRQYTGNAIPTIITAGFDNPGSLVATIDDPTGWPTGGANGKFTVTIDRGLANEERILVQSRSGNTLTVASSGDRGVDGTSAGSHTPGVSAIHHGHAAYDMDDSNKHIFDVAQDDHTQYMRADGVRHDLTARHLVGTSIGRGTPTTIVPDAAAAQGVSTLVAGADHTHGIDTAVPVAIGTALAEGAGTSFARSTHVHTVGAGGINNSNMFAADVVNLAAMGPLAVGTAELVDLAVTTAKLAADSVTTDKIADFDIQTFDPTWDNVTLGTGGVEQGTYIEVGNLIVGTSGFLLGTVGGNITGPLVLHLPEPLHAAYRDTHTRAPWICAGRMFDSSAPGGAFYSCTAQIGDPFNDDVGIAFNFATAGTAGWTTTLPVNWAANDTMAVLFVYLRA